MEWDDLRYFLAVARDGSLRKAARVLRTSPATTARHIAALERRVGARLFDHNQTGYALTESGEAVRLRAENVEQAVLSLEREALGRDLQPTGKVRLTTTNDIATHVIGPNLGDFRRRYPEILLEMINLSRREADIALRTVRPTQPDAVVRHVGWWNLGLYAARTYAKAHRLKPGSVDAGGLEIVTYNEEMADRRGGPWFAKHAADGDVAIAAEDDRREDLIWKRLAKVEKGRRLRGLWQIGRRDNQPAHRIVDLTVWRPIDRNLRGKKCPSARKIKSSCLPIRAEGLRHS